MENVSGMVKGKMKLVFADILRELKASGYRVSARVLNAMYFGVPQSRARMIFIGVREDLGIEPTHPKAQTRPVTLREALQDLNDLAQQRAPISELETQRWRETRRGDAHHERFSLLRLSWSKPAPTLLRDPGHGQMHPDEPRNLSVGELVGGWNEGVKRIGNSVPPLFMKAIAEHVRATVLSPALQLVGVD